MKQIQPYNSNFLSFFDLETQIEYKTRWSIRRMLKYILEQEITNIRLIPEDETDTTI
jgi:hypothetical protein